MAEWRPLGPFAERGEGPSRPSIVTRRPARATPSDGTETTVLLHNYRCQGVDGDVVLVTDIFRCYRTRRYVPEACQVVAQVDGDGPAFAEATFVSYVGRRAPSSPALGER